jgi:hypothetical protein
LGLSPWLGLKRVKRVLMRVSTGFHRLPRQIAPTHCRSDDGYTYTFVSHVARQSDEKSWALPAEGPNEHTATILPNGDLMTIFRTEAGDGNGRYGPYYSTVSNNSGQTWSVAIPLKDSNGNYIGCARPHMVQLGNTTLLAGGRMMMGRDYSRSFSVWMHRPRFQKEIVCSRILLKYSSIV